MAASKEQILEAISNMTLMEVVDLVKMMEDKFGVKIPDEDAEKILTVADAVDYVVATAGG